MLEIRITGLQLFQQLEQKRQQDSYDDQFGHVIALSSSLRTPANLVPITTPLTAS
jgi:hypothetical protein